MEKIYKSNVYLEEKRIRYNNKYGFSLSKQDYSKYFDLLSSGKIAGNEFFDYGLKSFDSSNVFYNNHSELSNLIATLIELSKDKNIKDNIEEIMESTYLSEIESTLRIEGIQTTRKKIKDIKEKKIVVDKEDINDIIVKNMIEGFNFVREAPKFNQENLLKLYKILSNDVLPKEDQISEDDYYRNDDVTVGRDEGAPYNKVKECMDSLFENIHKFDDVVQPLIAHYYIIYIHPYFDYNGRCARMVSIWLLHIHNLEDTYLYLSEAIDMNKNKYYSSIRCSRSHKNDMTYFIRELLKLSVEYNQVYKRLYIIKSNVKSSGEDLNKEDLNKEDLFRIKKIMLIKDEHFSWKKFKEVSGVEITKQACLNFLNKLEGLNILKSVINSKKEKMYELIESND